MCDLVSRQLGNTHPCVNLQVLRDHRVWEPCTGCTHFSRRNSCSHRMGWDISSLQLSAVLHHHWGILLLLLHHHLHGCRFHHWDHQTLHVPWDLAQRKNYWAIILKQGKGSHIHWKWISLLLLGCMHIQSSTTMGFNGSPFTGLKTHKSLAVRWRHCINEIY